MSEIVELTKVFSFDSSHFLPKVGFDHKCKSMHGHGFKVSVSVKGEISEETGWLIDFAEIKEAVQPIIDSLDHKFLNDVKGLENPTSENIARFIWYKARVKLPALSKVTVYESENSVCSYITDQKEPDPLSAGFQYSQSYQPSEQLMEGKRFVKGVCGDHLNFNSAHFLIKPDGSREEIHGHTYRVSAYISTFRTETDGRFITDALTESVLKITSKLDRRILLQRKNKFLSISRINDSIHLVSNKFLLTFKQNEVAELNIDNTTTEALVYHFIGKLVQSVKEWSAPAQPGEEIVSVTIDEGRGQRASAAVKV